MMYLHSKMTAWFDISKLGVVAIFKRVVGVNRWPANSFQLNRQAAYWLTHSSCCYVQCVSCGAVNSKEKKTYNRQYTV